MEILTLATTATIGIVAAKIGTFIGDATYSIIHNIANYVWFDVENGYLKDHPEDTEVKNDFRTIINRIKKSTFKQEISYEDDN